MLYDPEGPSFLISEALRGHGAVLVDDRGEPFMEGRHPGGSMATRDVVSRAIVAQMKESGRPCVYLNATARDAAATRRRFPNIHRHCLERGIDMTSQPIPVIPAAHYLCGGVRTGLDGRTDVPGLCAAGEVAFTGLHGANRLASNSLLEALVFAGRAAAQEAGKTDDAQARALPAWPLAGGPATGDRARRADELAAQRRRQVQRRMWEDVGIVRTDAGLERACAELDEVAEEIEAQCRHHGWTPELLEARNLAAVAQLVAHGARQRGESRGVHYNSDHPHRNDSEWQHDTLMRASR
ncbi:MAG: FAD-binding protein [Gemmatimonadota bacterium]